jgi:hypothetical protein
VVFVDEAAKSVAARDLARRRRLPVARGSACRSLDPFTSEHLVEGGSELAVAVMDEELHPLKHAGEAQIPRLLVTQTPVGLVGEGGRDGSRAR